MKGGRDNRRGSPYIKGMRVPLMILSALGAGLVAGRKLLGKEITGRKNKAISRRSRKRAIASAPTR